MTDLTALSRVAASVSATDSSYHSHRIERRHHKRRAKKRSDDSDATTDTESETYGTPKRKSKKRARGSNTAESSASSYSRRTKSLGALCEKFFALYDTAASTERTISLDTSAKHLGVERRRIYDIVNILESVNVVERNGKNQYVWNGVDGIPSAVAKMQRELTTTNKALGENLHFGMSLMNTAMFDYVTVTAITDFDDAISAAYKDEPMNKLIYIAYKRDQLRPTTEAVGDHLVSSAVDAKEDETATADGDEADGAEGRSKPRNKRRRAPRLNEEEKVHQSLGYLSVLFVELFLSHESRMVSLEDAARWLLRSVTPTHIQLADKQQPTFKSKVRRLYDIANVFCSFGLIRKVQLMNTRKPAFKWEGAGVVPLNCNQSKTQWTEFKQHNATTTSNTAAASTSRDVDSHIIAADHLPTSASTFASAPSDVKLDSDRPPLVPTLSTLTSSDSAASDGECIDVYVLHHSSEPYGDSIFPIAVSEAESMTPMQLAYAPFEQPNTARVDYTDDADKDFIGTAKPIAAATSLTSLSSRFASSLYPPYVNPHAVFPEEQFLSLYAAAAARWKEEFLPLTKNKMKVPTPAVYADSQQTTM